MAVINREALIEEYKLSQRRKDEEDIGFTWVVKANHISLVNWTEMAEQVNQWKDLKNGGVREVRAYDYNNKEFVVEGKKWYVLIVQHYTNDEMEDEANIMCPVSLMLFGTMVSGMTYATKKPNRSSPVAVCAVSFANAFTDTTPFPLLSIMTTIEK